MTPADDPLVGVTLDGKYRIEARVGAGAMGAVYRARHLGLGAPRAIKVMKAELAADPAFVERFQREARLVESLRHPHLVTLHDFARLPDGTWYIVSELVEGETLATLLQRRGPLPAAEVAEILGQVVEGVALAHARGVVHRDLSPDNVMIGPGPGGGRFAKVLDFGLAKDVVSPEKDPTRRTGSSVLLGKIGYASPEQMGSLAPGEAIDGRADVFSTAAVAYRMLVGRLPWRSDSLQSYVHDLLIRPEADLHDEIRRHAPPAWHGFFVRGLSRDRARRTPSLLHLRSELLAAASGAAEEAETGPLAPPGPAASVSAAPGGRRSARVRRIALAGVAAAVLAGVVAVLLPPRPSVPVADEIPITPPPSGPAAPAPPGRDLPETLPPRPALAGPVAGAREVHPSRHRAPAVGDVAAPFEPAPEPAPSEAPGTIVVYSSPEALVSLDGQPRGRTPTTITLLRPGRHALSLATEDGQRSEESIELAAGQTVERRHAFPGFGSLAVLSDVWVEVRLDGGPLQQTPLYLRKVRAGRHTVTASKPGHRAQVLDVVVEEGKPKTIRIELQREEEGSPVPPGGPPGE